MRGFIFIITLALASAAFFNDAKAISLPSKYKTGPEICPKGFKAHEKWVSSPSLGSRLSKPTAIYTWTNKPFDPKLPTMVFAPGGPGDTAHNSWLSLDDWNIIFFDYRGVACSRPSSRSLFLNPDFYNSHWIAQDIERIRQTYKVKKLTVYGVSYGTIPAHLYGYFYPSHTSSIILEGVIYRGGQDLIQPKRLAYLLQSFFDSLPLSQQDQILKYSHDPRFSPYWFSAVGNMMLYLDRSIEAFNAFLSNTLFDESVALDLYNNFTNRPYPTETDEPNFGHVFMAMIGCQELGMNLDGYGPYFVFQNRKLVPSQNNPYKRPLCDFIQENASPSPSNSRPIYSAARYPSKSTTFYIQGLHDGATPADHASRHYRHASHADRSLLFVTHGGHAPLYGPLSSGYIRGPGLELRKELLSQMGFGLSPSKLLLHDLSVYSRMTWRLLERTGRPDPLFSLPDLETNKGVLD